MKSLLGEPSRTFGIGMLNDGMVYLNANVPIDRGTLRNDLQPNVGLTRVEGDPVETITWGSRKEYGARLDKGEKGGKKVNAQDLERWVKRRGLATGKRAKGLAMAIASSISRQGPKNEPHYVAGPHKDEPTKGWFSRLEGAVNAALGPRRAKFEEDVTRRWEEILSGR